MEEGEVDNSGMGDVEVLLGLREVGCSSGAAVICSSGWPT